MTYHFMITYELFSKIPVNVTWHHLKDLFKQAGNVSRANLFGGKGETYGVVLFANSKDANEAIGLNNFQTELNRNS